MRSPFKITVYDKDFGFKGYVGNPESVTATPRHNQQGTATIVLDADHRMVPTLLTPGARVVLEYRAWPSKANPDPGWEFLMSGPIVARRGQGPAIRSRVTFDIADDIRILDGVLGWPVPTASIFAQTTAEYATYTGPAETVLKDVVTANAVTRLGLPLTVATDLGRGATVPSGMAFRFHALSEKVLPALEAAGLGVTVRQSGAGLVLDVYEPRTYVHTLSERAGTITEWSWTDLSPTATRAVAGGKGEGTARVFSAVANTILEDEWGDVREIFRDATDAETTANLNDRAVEEMNGRAQRFGFSVKLSETGMFQYGQAGVLVGDLVTVDIGGATRTDVLRECTLAFSRDAGATQTPVIGDVDNTPDRALARFLDRLRRAVNNTKVKG